MACVALLELLPHGCCCSVKPLIKLQRSETGQHQPMNLTCSVWVTGAATNQYTQRVTRVVCFERNPAALGQGRPKVSSCMCHAGVVVYNFVAGGIHVAQTAPLHLHSLPVTFGLSAFVFSGHAVFPSIYRSMKDRSQYPKMLDTTYYIVGITGALIGKASRQYFGIILKLIRLLWVFILDIVSCHTDHMII